MKTHALLRPLRSACLAGFAAFAIPALPAVTVFIDFGNADAGAGWNGLGNAAEASIADAIDSTGAPTGIGIAIPVSDGFTGVNNNGATGTGIYPDFAPRDSFCGNADAVFGTSPINPSATVELTGLTVGTPYNFTFYASRGGVGDNRSTRYTLTGTGPSMFAELDAANNTTNTVSIFGVLPDPAGAINLVVSEGTANTNGTGFYYIGALEINSVPEPSRAVLLLGSLVPFVLRRRR